MRFIFLTVLICSVAAADVPATLPSHAGNDFRSFTLTATASPTPAMKYALMVDPSERRSGNAANYYLQAALLIGQEDSIALDTALFPDPSSTRSFDAGAEAYYEGKTEVFDLLSLAAHCDQCDWQTNYSAEGIGEMLPRLGRMRVLSQTLLLRQLQLIRQGKCDDAVEALKLGYEFAYNAGRQPMLIGGEVALGFVAENNVALAEMMKRPESPNLYWALATLPRPFVNLRYTMDGERIFELKPGAMPAGYMMMYGPQYRATSDDLYKMFALPYPVLLPRLKVMADRARTKIASGNDGNLLDIVAPSFYRVTQVYARLDRQLAALTAVEAIRSYAAANHGNLPASLADVIDTPVPDNPATGKPFEYSAEGKTATLADSQSGLIWPLKYTIQIRP